VQQVEPEPQPQAQASMPPAVDMMPMDLARDTPSVAPAPELRPVVHTVQWKRETLFVIARWYTGSGNNWRRLAKVNPNIDPGWIHIGDTILIPNDLLKRRQPMPNGYIKPRFVPKRNAPLQPPEPPPNIEAPPLYGPIDHDTASEAEKSNELPLLLETLE
jgi:hypothetical protein